MSRVGLGPRPDARPDQSHRARLALQIVVATNAAAALCFVIWLSAANHLPAPLDIVGYSTFHDFNHNPRFLFYRLALWVFPLLTAGFFWSLRRWGPLSPPGERTPRVPLLVQDDPIRKPRDRDTPLGTERVGALLPAAALVMVAASSGDAVAAAHVSVGGVLAGVAYLLIVLLISALLVNRSGPRTTTPWGRVDVSSVVNTFASALAVVISLGYFVRHTAAITTKGSVDDWPWLPVWVFVLAAVVVTGWLAWRLARGARPRSLERITVAVLVGSAAVWILTAGLPSSSPPLAGFDDMMGVTGADLWTRGYFPWRDFMFIHGFFEDSLRSAAGFGLFEHTLWGANAAGSALWTPLGWIGMYLLAVWAAPRRWLLQVCALVLVMWLAHTCPLPLRFVAIAPIFILVGEAIRRGQRRWTVIMTVALFIEAVLVPEASFQVISITVVLVLRDLAHRPTGAALWRSLSKTKDFVLAGLVCSLVWTVYLAAHGALVPFVRYYLIFGPGHAASGSLPLGGPYSDAGYMGAYVASIILVMITIGLALVVRFSRGPVSATQWVMLTSALFAGMYGEKGLARADNGHLLQSVAMTLPLLLLWVMRLLSSADERWSSRNERNERRAAWTRHPAPALALAAFIVGFPSVVHYPWRAPANNKSVVAGTSVPLVGYANRGTVDQALLKDLHKIFATLSRPGGTVFDFTNSPGYVYYLLQQQSPTVFYHVSMTVPEFSQTVAIDELEKKRPALVVFDSSTTGLPAWDGPRNEVRHFEISQYLLDGWTPVFRTHGLVFMARNDLVHTLPPLPRLSEVPQTHHLYFFAAPCEWGYIPNFLTSKPRGKSIVLRADPVRNGRSIALNGWAYDLDADRRVRKILLAVGGKVVGSLVPGAYRPDVAQAYHNPSMGSSGFGGSFMVTKPGRLTPYAVLSDGVAHPVGRVAAAAPTRLKQPGGPTLETSRTPVAGKVDHETEAHMSISEFDVPPSTNLGSYELADLSSPDRIGRSDIVLKDSLVGRPGLDSSISLRTLSSAGKHIPVRVGSCLQWHGYHTKKLYLLQSGDHPVDEIRLSDVS